MKRFLKKYAVDIAKLIAAIAVCSAISYALLWC